MSIRCFIAIELPEAIKNTIADFISPLKPLSDGIKWVNPANMHITIKFLGHTPQDKIDMIKDTLIRQASSFGPMDIGIKGTGAFPNLRRPSVLWAGLTYPAELEQLHIALNEALITQHPAGDRDKVKKFRPHLTLGRIKRNVRDIKPVISELMALRGHEFGSFRAERIWLIKSDLTQTGPIYTPLASAMLSG